MHAFKTPCFEVGILSDERGIPFQKSTSASLHGKSISRQRVRGASGTCVVVHCKIFAIASTVASRSWSSGVEKSHLVMMCTGSLCHRPHLVFSFETKAICSEVGHVAQGGRYSFTLCKLRSPILAPQLGLFSTQSTGPRLASRLA